jgi:DNA-binding response OmpR family regulator
MPGAEAHPTGPRRVLLVEDHVDTRQMYAEFLGLEFDVLTAATGEDALNLLRAESPDVIVTDLSLPGIDGFELVSRVRAADTLKAIPIVCLSGYGGSDHEQRALAAGCDRILQKPCMPDVLSAVVTEMIDHADKRRKHA